MGYFLGHKIPEYNPFWEEPEYSDQPDWWQWYHLGWEDGYAEYPDHARPRIELQKENDALKALIAANYRVMKEEIRKELTNGKSE